MKPLVFLHGWGQSSQIWFQQFDAFPDAIFLNLPGHGGAPDCESWLENILAQLPDEPCILVGWSLGGMLAMQLAAAHPHRIASLVLVSTTPCFRNAPDWHHGCSDEVFDGFRQGLEHASAKTMSRFFALMLHGDGLVRARFNQLARAAVDRAAAASEKGLRQGLQWLGDADLRGMLADVRQPALVMHGADDAIIPVTAGAFLAEELADATWHPFYTCGHAPFLTQAQTFNEQLEAWCLNTSSANR